VHIAKAQGENMKTTELQELLKANTTDSGLNYDEIAKHINEEVNTIRDKSIEKYKETAKQDLAGSIQDEFLKQYEFENVDQFKAFVDNSKASNDEVKAKATRLEQELAKKQKAYDELQGNYQTINQEITVTKQKELARSTGVKADMIDYALFEASKLVNDDTDFKTALEKLVADKPTLIGETERIKFGQNNPDNNTSVKDGLLGRYMELKKERKI